LSYKPGRTHKARRQSDPPILVSDKLRRAAKAESTAAWHRAKMDRQIAALGRQPSDLPCLALELLENWKRARLECRLADAERLLERLRTLAQRPPEHRQPRVDAL